MTGKKLWWTKKYKNKSAEKKTHHRKTQTIRLQHTTVATFSLQHSSNYCKKISISSMGVSSLLSLSSPHILTSISSVVGSVRLLQKNGA